MFLSLYALWLYATHLTTRLFLKFPGNIQRNFIPIMSFLGRHFSGKSPTSPSSKPRTSFSRSRDWSPEIAKSNASSLSPSRHSALIIPNDAVSTMPDESELDQQFSLVISEMGLSKEKTAAMFNLSKEKKWHLITQMANTSLNSSDGNRKKTRRMIDGLLKALQSSEHSPILNFLTALEVSLRTESVSWVLDFMQQDGLPVLLMAMETFGSKKNSKGADCNIILYVTRCIKALVNVGQGLDSFIQHAESINFLAGCYPPWDFGESCVKDTKKLILELNAIFCVVPNGHTSVLKAWAEYRIHKREGYRFQTIVRDCEAYDEDFKRTALTFINAVIIAPNHAAERQAIRFEFMDAGLPVMLEELKPGMSTELQTQVAVFLDETAYDLAELGMQPWSTKDTFDEAQFHRFLAQLDSNSYYICVQLLNKIQNLPKDIPRKSRCMMLLNHVVNRLLLDPFPNYENSRSLPSPLDINPLLENAQADLEKERYLQENSLYQVEIRQLYTEINSLREKAQLVGPPLREDSTSLVALTAQHEKAIEKLKEAWETDQKRYTEQIDQLTEVIKAELYEKVDLNHIPELDKLNEATRTSIYTALLRATKSTNLFENTRSSLALPSIPLRFQSQQVQTSISDIPPPPPCPVPILLPMETSVGSIVTPPPAPALPPLPPPPPPPQALFHGKPVELTNCTGGSPPAPPPPPPPLLPPQFALNGGVCSMLAKPVSTFSNAKPSVKVRNLAWSKVSTNASVSFWKSLDGTSEVQLDYNELESMFAVTSNTLKPANSGDLVSTPKTSNLSSSTPAKISLIDSKRAYNISIMFGRLKLTFNEIRDALIEMNDSKLDLQLVASIKSNCPTIDDEQALADYISAPPAKLAELDRPDQFLVAMISVPRLSMRLDCWIFKAKFTERLNDVSAMINSVHAACEGLSHSLVLKKALKLILKIGNFVNFGSFRGGAVGFSIDFLGRLTDIKINGQSKQNLLHYLALTLKSDIGTLENDLKDLDQASRVSLSALQLEVKELCTGFKAAKGELDNHDSSSPFHIVFTQFVADQNTEIDSLGRASEAAVTNFKNIAKAFGEDSETATPETFFSIFKLFITSLMKAHRENMDREMKNAKVMKAANSGTFTNIKKTPVSDRGNTPTMSHLNIPTLQDKEIKGGIVLNTRDSENRKGVADELLSTLKSGNAFRHRRTVAKGVAPDADFLCPNVIESHPTTPKELAM